MGYNLVGFTAPPPNGGASAIQPSNPKAAFEGFKSYTNRNSA